MHTKEITGSWVIIKIHAFDQTVERPKLAAIYWMDSLTILDSVIYWNLPKLSWIFRLISILWFSYIGIFWYFLAFLCLNSKSYIIWIVFLSVVFHKCADNWRIEHILFQYDGSIVFQYCPGSREQWSCNIVSIVFLLNVKLM